MSTSAFAVDFFDTVLWDNKLNFARSHQKGFFWGIFESCIKQHDSLRVFVFTLRQWRRLLGFIRPDEMNEIKAGLQRILSIKTSSNKFYKNINLSFYCIIVLDETVRLRMASGSVLKNKIKVELMKQSEGSNNFFFKNDLFRDYADEDGLYADMNINDFLRQGLRGKIRTPQKLGWLYYFSSQKHPDDKKKRIKYCPVKTTCSWIDFLNRCKGI